MKIVLINPKLRIEEPFIDYPYLVGLGLHSMKEWLKSRGHKVLLKDTFLKGMHKEYGELVLGDDKGLVDEVLKTNPDACILLNSPFLKLHMGNDGIRRLAKELGGLRLILADCFITGMHYHDYDPEKLIQDYGFDAICKHESEMPIIRALKKNGVFGSDFMDNIDSIPYPRLSDEEMKSFNAFLKGCSDAGIADMMEFSKKSFPINTSRGCVYNCNFCSSRIGGRKYRQHSIRYLDEYLGYLASQGIRTLIFLDDCMNPDKKRLSDIMDLLEKHGMDCYLPNGLRADNLDRGTIRRLKKVTPWLKVSAESATGRIMQNIGKGISIEDIERSARLCKEEELPLYIHYLIGFPEETHIEMLKTLNFALELYRKYGAYPLAQAVVPIRGSELSQTVEAPEDYWNHFKGKGVVNELLNDFKLALKQGKTNKLIINTTYECINECLFCAVGDRKGKKGDMQKQLNALERAYERGARCVDLDGGEPLLAPHIFVLIKKAEELGYGQIHLTTNGRLLSDPKTCRKVIDSGLTSILISLHGSNAEIHEANTGIKGSFIETVKGIDNIMRMGNDISIGVNTTVSKHNVKDLMNIKKFINLLGIKKWNIQKMTPFGIAKKADVPDEDLFSRILHDINEDCMDDANMKVQLINFEPCIVEGYGADMSRGDIEKNQRNMLFVDREEQNLAGFLSKMKKRKDKCTVCRHSLICQGFWRFEDEKD